MTRIRLAAAMTMTLAAAQPEAAQERSDRIQLVADTAASSIKFSVRFMGLGRVWGEFHEFSGAVDYDPHDLARSTVEFRVDVSTIDTDNGHRDQDLSENWFEMARFPYAAFRSDSIVEHAERWLAFGRLQIKGVTRDVMVPLRITVGTENGVVRARVAGSFTIDRMIFDVDDEPAANAFFDASTMVVGDDVTIDLRLALVAR